MIKENKENFPIFHMNIRTIAFGQDCAPIKVQNYKIEKSRLTFWGMFDLTNSNEKFFLGVSGVAGPIDPLYSMLHLCNVSGIWFWSSLSPTCCNSRLD